MIEVRAQDAPVEEEAVEPGMGGQGPIRQAAVGAGIPLTSPAMTINAVCLSGMEAVIAAARNIEAGEHGIVVAAGMESMSRAPHAFRGRAGARYGSIEVVDTLEHDALLDSFEHVSMGASTEAGNADNNVTRESQDAWAAGSHQRAQASAAFLAEEIAPYTLTSRAGETVVTDDDGRYVLPLLAVGRYELRAELSGFRPLLRQGIETEMAEHITRD